MGTRPSSRMKATPKAASSASEFTRCFGDLPKRSTFQTRTPSNSLRQASDIDSLSLDLKRHCLERSILPLEKQLALKHSTRRIRLELRFPRARPDPW